MVILNILLTSIASVVVLFILTKLMGNRQMSQLSLFDYINGITIGSIAAEMATALEDDILKPLTAMIVYAAFTIGFSYIGLKSTKARRFITGKSLVLLHKGKLNEENFRKAKMDINEFLTQCRNAGYFNIADLNAAILEPNGKISFLPLALKRPVNPADMALSPEEDEVPTYIVLDGNILDESLKSTGNNEKWLTKELKKQGISGIDDVILAICDNNNNLTVYKKNQNDIR